MKLFVSDLIEPHCKTGTLPIISEQWKQAIYIKKDPLLTLISVHE